jgi:hypothetical protein
MDLTWSTLAIKFPLSIFARMWIVQLVFIELARVAQDD